MQYPIQLTNTTSSVKSSLRPSPLRHGFFLVAFALAGFAFSPAAQAVSPPPDGGYLGGNTAESEDALFSLTTGTNNTATGFGALFRNIPGYSNTANGAEALFSNTTGYFNTSNVTSMTLPVLGGSSPKAPGTAPTSVVFTDIALESGFQDRLSHGRAIVGGDFNGDGQLDFFLGNPGDPTVLDDESFIFWNNGVDGNGNLILSKGQVLCKGEICFTASTADYDNDGDKDLFVGVGGQEGIGLDYLFRNDGGVFIDVSETAQIRGPKDSNGNWVPTATSSGTWADYDNDGDLDLFVASRQNARSLILPGDLGWRNSLFRNNGDGTFTDVTAVAGVGGTLSSMTSAWGDYNNDGWMDLYVPHGALGFGIPGFQLYQNNHDGTFTELNIDENSLNFGDRATWAANAADFNNDGLEDILSWARGQTGDPDSHALLINHGNWTFTNEAVSAGLVPPGVPVPRVMGCQVADYDNDGDLDLVMANGGPDHGDKDNLWMNKFADTGLLTFDDVSSLIDYPALPDPTCIPPRIEASKLFANQSWFIDSANMLVNMPEGMDSCDNPVRRVEVAPGQDLCNPPYPYRGHGVIFYDFDNDGDVDMFMSKGGTRITIDSVEPNRLFRNDGGNANNWFYLDLEGVVSNKDAVGAEVKLTSSQGGLNPRVQYRDLQEGAGFSASGPHLIHFGLGQDDTVDEVVITWPSGASTILPSTGANQTIRVREPIISFTTFNDGTAPGWTPVSGSWSVQGATYVQSSGSGKAMSLNTQGSMADFSVVAKLSYSSGKKKIGLMGRASPDGKTFYAAVLLGSTAQLVKSVNGTMAPIGGPIAIGTMTPGKAYLVRLQFKGSQVQMWVDGVLGPVVNDTSIASGSIGLFTMSTQAGFDNVGVYLR